MALLPYVISRAERGGGGGGGDALSRFQLRRPTAPPYY